MYRAFFILETKMTKNGCFFFRQVPYLGFGLGLRTAHCQTILENKPAIDWFEILTENYLAPGGKPLNDLEKIRVDYPIVMHGVSLSIGSNDSLDFEYLAQLKGLAKRFEPCWILGSFMLDRSQAA